MAKLYDVRVRFTGFVYKIDEIVTKEGLYITWENVFGTKESAKDFLKKKGYVPGPTKYEEPHENRYYGL